jgi:hypothetical protein
MNQLGDNMMNQLGDNMMNQLGDNMMNQLGNNMMNQLGGNKDEIRDLIFEIDDSHFNQALRIDIRKLKELCKEILKKKKINVELKREYNIIIMRLRQSNFFKTYVDPENPKFTGIDITKLLNFDDMIAQSVPMAVGAMSPSSSSPSAGMAVTAMSPTSPSAAMTVTAMTVTAMSRDPSSSSPSAAMGRDPSSLLASAEMVAPELLCSGREVHFRHTTIDEIRDRIFDDPRLLESLQVEDDFDRLHLEGMIAFFKKFRKLSPEIKKRRLYNYTVQQFRSFKLKDGYPFEKLKFMDLQNGLLYDRTEEVKEVKHKKLELTWEGVERDLSEEKGDKDMVFLHLSRNTFVQYPSRRILLSALENGLQNRNCTVVVLDASCLETQWGVLPFAQRKLEHSSKFLLGRRYLHQTFKRLECTKVVSLKIPLQLPFPHVGVDSFSQLHESRSAVGIPQMEYFHNWNSSCHDLVHLLVKSKNLYNPYSLKKKQNELFLHLIEWQKMIKDKLKQNFFPSLKYMECADPTCIMHSGYLIDLNEAKNISQLDESGLVPIHKVIPGRLQECLNFKCREQLCRECGKVYHGEASPCMSPEEEKERVAFIESARVAGSIVKPCNNCGFGIVKISGCLVVRCSKCMSDTCWTCGNGFKSTDFVQGNHRYHSTCGWQDHNYNPLQDAANFGRGEDLDMAAVAAVAAPVPPAPPIPPAHPLPPPAPPLPPQQPPH